MLVKLKLENKGKKVNLKLEKKPKKVRLTNEQKHKGKLTLENK